MIRIYCSMNNNYKHYILPLVWFCCGILFICTEVKSEERQVFYFDIPAQEADVSLIEFAEITEIDVLYLHQKIKNHNTKRLLGYFTAIDAIGYLIEGTSLIVEIDAKGNYKVIDNPNLKKKHTSIPQSFLRSLFSSLEESKNPLKDSILESGIERIYITSQKRQEALRRVPLAVSVLSKGKIDDSFVNNIENVQSIIPSLTLRKGNTARNSSIFLRGVGTLSFSVAAEPSVSTIVDGVVMARSGQIFSDLYDIDRMEVLRGSQGTLFGKNASSGVVHVITNSPTDDFEGNLEYSIFQGHEFILKSSFSGSISEKFNARISTYQGDFDGLTKNEFINENINGYQSKGLRFLLDYFPNDALDMRFSLDYFKADDNCCIELTAGNDVSFSTLNTVDHDKKSGSIDREVGASITANIDLNFAMVTAITAYRVWDNTEDNDRDFMSRVGKVYRSNQLNEFQLHEFGQQTFYQFSQELRLGSINDSLLEYTLGIFYFDVNSKRFYARDDRLCLSTTLLNDICEEQFSTFVNPSATANMTSYFKNFSIFGQGKYNFIEDAYLIFGLRWTKDEVGYTHARLGNQDLKNLIAMKNDPNNPIDFGAPGIRDEDFQNTDSQSKTNLSYKVGIQYDFSAKSMLYATYTTGFKGPAFDVSFSLNKERSKAIDPEMSKSVELGLKGESLDGSLYVGVAVYYSELEGFQMNSGQELNGNITSNLRNIGTVNNSGFEVDFSSNLSKNLTLSGSFSFLKDAKIKKVLCVDELHLNLDCLSRKNERLMLSPRVSTALGVDYNMPLTNDYFNLSVSALYSYQGEMFSDDLENPNEKIKSYGLLNASINLLSKNNVHKLSLIAKNIMNEHYPSQIICCAAGSQGSVLRYQIPRDSQRYFGLSYKVFFN